MKVYLTEKESVNVVDYYLDWRLENKTKKIAKKDLEKGYKGEHARELLDKIGVSVIEEEIRGFYVSDKNKWKEAKTKYNF